MTLVVLNKRLITKLYEIQVIVPNISLIFLIIKNDLHKPSKILQKEIQIKFSLNLKLINTFQKITLGIKFLYMWLIVNISIIRDWQLIPVDHSHRLKLNITEVDRSFLIEIL